MKFRLKSAMFYQNFSDFITKKISDRRPGSILLVFEISLFKTFYRSWKHPKTFDIVVFSCENVEKGHISGGRTTRSFVSIRLWQMSVTLSWWPPRRDCPASSGFSKLDATLWMERNRWERPFAFPSSMLVHLTPESERQITSLPLDSQET